MRASSPGLWPIATILCVVFVLAESAGSNGQSPVSTSAGHCWADGRVAAALDAIDAAPRTRETELNAAVVRLYAGQASDATAVLAALLAREGRWTPALRWMARAQAELGQIEALDSASALLTRPDAEVLDRLWAGELFLRYRRAEQARATFDAVRRWNGGINLDWQRVASTPVPPVAAVRSRVEPAPGQHLAPSPLRPIEQLRYEVKYLFFHLAAVTLETGGLEDHGGEAARRVVFTATSSNGVPFFHIDSRFESLVSTDGAVLAHRHVASDSDAGADEAGYDMDRRSRRCTVRSVRNGIFDYHVLPLPENAQDGVSVLLAARRLARVRGSAVVPTAVDGMWWPTHLRTLGVESIRWRGHDVRAVRLQSLGAYRGVGGASGPVDIWMSDDERSVPYRVKMKVAVGSVVLDLLPDETLVASSVASGEVVR